MAVHLYPLAKGMLQFAMYKANCRLHWQGERDGDWKDYESDLQDMTQYVLWEMYEEVPYKPSKEDLMRIGAIRCAMNALGEVDGYNCPRSFREWRLSL